jgi:hypothetical protein
VGFNRLTLLVRGLSTCWDNGAVRVSGDVGNDKDSRAHPTRKEKLWDGFEQRPNYFCKRSIKFKNFL